APYVARREVCSAVACLRAPAVQPSGNGHPVLPPPFRRPRFSVPAAIALAVLVGLGVHFARRGSVPPELAFSDFLQHIEHGQVAQIRFADGAIDVTLRDGRVAHTVPPPEFLASSGTFVTDLAR